MRLGSGEPVGVVLQLNALGGVTETDSMPPVCQDVLPADGARRSQPRIGGFVAEAVGDGGRLLDGRWTATGDLIGDVVMHRKGCPSRRPHAPADAYALRTLFEPGTHWSLVRRLGQQDRQPITRVISAQPCGT
jgi:hypothetical protein